MTRPANPGKQAFWHDMNRYGNAEYRHTGERYILELDSYPSGDFRLLVWEAVKQGGEYIHPPGENYFVWDAVGEEVYEDREEGREKMRKITGGHAVRTWCQLHPYTGPRTPWADRSPEVDL